MAMTKTLLVAIACLSLVLPGCAELPFAVPGEDPVAKQLANTPPAIPGEYPRTDEQASSALMEWQQFFKDQRLAEIIDSALQNNQELNILLQEIEVARAEVLRRKGAYLPFVTLGAGAGAEKVGQYTRSGAVEDNLDVKNGKNFPDPLPDFRFAAEFSWEIDIWKKLRNEKKAATLRYLATREGRNFMITNLVAEIAGSYYELMALDNQLIILKQMIEIQQNALETVRLEKQAARVTELAVQRFVGEVAKNRSRLYYVQQQIIVTENRINFLAGRYPQHIERPSDSFDQLALDPVHPGSPADLLSNRPDVRQAELELAAAKLDVKAARARFYPRLDLAAAVGFDSFALASLVTAPESLLYNIAAELMVPLINKSQIRAAYNGASAQQIATIYRYQQVVLNAYVEVLNQLSQISNINQSYDLKAQQVAALSQAIDVAGQLFRSARADYTEVLLTQRDALESKIELVELKQQQANALVRAYKALGGGYSRVAPDGDAKS
jgi:NodT family efflux transporter outer membrane factor (OMF) lipoprotein